MSDISTYRRPQWVSVHIQPIEPVDRFLVEVLSPFIQRERAKGHMRRVFFLRYGRDKDFHIRLRVLPTAVAANMDFAEELEEFWNMIRTGKDNRGPRAIWYEPYSRTVHYFGESLASVYSELLNEYTSYLSLDVLVMSAQRAAVLHCVVVHILASLIEAISRASSFSIERSIALTRRIMGQDEQVLQYTDDGLAQVLSRETRRNRAAFQYAFAEDQHLPRISALLERAVEPFPHVVAHSLHLFCNKVGLPIWGEYNVLVGVRSLLSTEGIHESLA